MPYLHTVEEELLLAVLSAGTTGGFSIIESSQSFILSMQALNVGLFAGSNRVQSWIRDEISIGQEGDTGGTSP